MDESIAYYENPRGRRKGKRRTPPRGKGGRFRKRKTSTKRRRRRNPSHTAAAAANPARPRRPRRRNMTLVRSNPRRRNPATGMVERGTRAVVKMGTLALGGYVGTGVAKFLTQKIEVIGDFLTGLNLSEKQSSGVASIVLGLLVDPLGRMAGVPARMRSPIRDGVILFGIKDLLDEFVDENVYARMGLSDYLTIPRGSVSRQGLTDYLRTTSLPQQQLAAPPIATTYGVRIPTASYDGNPFSS